MRPVFGQLLYAVERVLVDAHAPHDDDPVVLEHGQAERAPRLQEESCKIYWIFELSPEKDLESQQDPTMLRN